MHYAQYELPKDSLAFNQSYKPCIDEMTFLLSSDFPIKFIGYLRIYSNGKAMAFSNNLKWQNFFLETVDCNSKAFERATLLVSRKKSPFVYIWPDFLRDKTLAALHAHNIWNGMSIYRHASDYIDSWSFAGETQDDKLCILFVQHTDIFEKFIHYVEKKYSFLFKPHESILFKFSIGDQSEKISGQYYSKECIKNFILHSPIFTPPLRSEESDTSLTRRENEVLDLLPLGMTAKEIARELELSHRTVERYLENLKTKLGCYRKSELVRKSRGIL